jgi:hypothetical protein
VASLSVRIEFGFFDGIGTTITSINVSLWLSMGSGSHLLERNHLVLLSEYIGRV